MEKKIKDKDEQLQEIVEDYEAVIRNFNDVIEKLLAERETGYNSLGDNSNGKISGIGGIGKGNGVKGG